MEKSANENQALLEVMNFTSLPTTLQEEIQPSVSAKCPISNFSALGVGFQPLVGAIQNIVGHGEAGMNGIYYVNTKGKQMMQLKSGAGYIGSLATETGMVGGGQAVITPFACDPTMLFMAAALMSIEKKLDSIENMQREMMEFIKAQEKAKLLGNLNTLMDVLNNYKYNWNNEKYKASNQVLVQDVRKEAEQSIVLMRYQIEQELKEKKIIHGDKKINTTIQMLQKEYKDYQLSLYLYAFSTFLDIMLLENFDAAFLTAMSQKIEEYSFQYQQLYTDTVNRIEEMTESSVQSVLARGVAGVSKGTGEVIAKIPIISKGKADEALIDSGERIKLKNREKADKNTRILISESMDCTKPFVENIHKVRDIFNKPLNMCFDDKNVYFLDEPLDA